MLDNILFVLLLIAAGVFFGKNVKRIAENIRLGKDVDRSDNPSARWKNMLRVALGQGKMTRRPIAGVLHIIVYVGFVIINIEVLEIIIDGITGKHRVFAGLGGLYDFLIGSFEVLAFLVWLACIIFLIRRNVLKIPRFHKPEMKGWAFEDANIILMSEIVLMSAFLIMNASDSILQARGVHHYVEAGSFPISSFLVPLLDGLSDSTLIFIERSMWWFHIIGIFAFLNYLPYSKHFHILLAFPNTYFANLKPKGQFTNLQAVKEEVEKMFDPNFDPYAAPAEGEEATEPERFGAKDVLDLTWKQLMDAYTCTECGRCTDSCPANKTGKKLSPRKIMMDVRDRIEEIGEDAKKAKAEGKPFDDGKSLLRDYISEEEVWACTSCNACVMECPVNIDPLSVIIDLRRYLVMEESKIPSELAGMLTNIENNGAPWQFSPTDRLKWAEED